MRKMLGRHLIGTQRALHLVRRTMNVSSNTRNRLHLKIIRTFEDPEGKKKPVVAIEELPVIAGFIAHSEVVVLVPSAQRPKGNSLNLLLGSTATVSSTGLGVGSGGGAFGRPGAALGSSLVQPAATL